MSHGPTAAQRAAYDARMPTSSGSTPPSPSPGPHRTTPLVHATMRTANLSLVLRHLRTHGGRPRARLAEETGLSKASMTNLVAELESRGLVRSGAAARDGHVGRPGIEVAVDPDRVTGLGVEVNVEYIAVVVVDLGGRVRHRSSVPTPPPGAGAARSGELLDAVAAQIAGGLAASAEQGLWTAGITVAAPGVLDDSEGAVHFAATLGWSQVPLREELERRLGPGTPAIALGNDAKLSALAEAPVLAARGIHDMVFLTGDVGVGAGIVSDGRLLRGWSGSSGEVGHMPVDPEGPDCRCGRRGCWETLVGLEAVLGVLDPEDPARRTDLPILERLAHLQRLLDAGDPAVTARFSRVSADLARGAGILVDVLDPRVIVLGGYFGVFADTLRGPLAEALAARSISALGPVEVVLPTHGLDSAAHGGAAAALERILEDPTLAPRLAD